MSSIDLAQIQELKDIMEEAFDDLISTYLTDSEAKLNLLKQAIADQNCSDIAELAHSVKGASANIFAEDLSALCRVVEDAGRAQQLDGLDQNISDIFAEFENVKTQLQQLN